jgi:hypothetical protein
VDVAAWRKSHRFDGLLSGEDDGSSLLLELNASSLLVSGVSVRSMSLIMSAAC